MCCILTDTGNTPEAESTIASLQNERGIILIIVLVMLLLLSILGATVLTSTTTELRVAGNYRNYQEAFFNAEGSLEQAMVSSVITGGVEPWDGLIYMNGPLPVIVGTVAELPVGTTPIATVHSEWLFEGKAPRGSGYDDSTVSNYYDVNVVGRGPNASEVAINSGIVKFH